MFSKLRIIWKQTVDAPDGLRMGKCDTDRQPETLREVQYDNQKTTIKEHSENYHCFMCHDADDFVQTRGLQCDLEPREYRDKTDVGDVVSAYLLLRISAFLTCGVVAIFVCAPMQVRVQLIGHL